MKGHSKAITHLSLLLTVILLGGNDTHAQITPMQGAEGRPSGHPTRQGTQVIEIRQHSIKADPAVNATFPKSWTPAPVAGAPPASPGDSEDAEAEDVGLQLAPIVEEDLSPGASRAVDLQVSSPSVLMGSARWIGTTSALQVTISLDTSTLATGTAYHFGLDRGGSFLQTRTSSGGDAKMSVTNTSGVAVKVRIVFAAGTL